MAGLIGSVVAFCGPMVNQATWEANTGNTWLVCDGRQLSSTANNGEFKPLFAIIGTVWGGDAAGNFNLPDFRGIFLRGVDGPAALDAGPRRISNTGGQSNGIGSLEDDTFASHDHQPWSISPSSHAHGGSVTPNPHSHGYTEIVSNGSAISGHDNGWGPVHPQSDGQCLKVSIDTTDLSIAVTAAGGAETRPKNAAVYYVIQAK